MGHPWGYGDLLCLASRATNSTLLPELGSLVVCYRKALLYEAVLERGILEEKRLIRSAVHP